ncbi:hypothetical protein [Alloacidobacterium sp.]|uniref:hypothetical protein n=1 Tax=Alloacidobacterium sp. TaxID=2951999 RepID=UPI002D793E8F|nr:hypothetical protein [Alloacidobacterium sp.]
MGSLTFLTLCSAWVVAQTSAPNTPKPPDTPSAVHRLYVEDQEDTKTIKDEATNAEYLQHVKVRQKTLRTMLAAGQVTSGDDFLEAAFIFQHGDTADDILFAHILAMEAIARGTSSAKWIAAATLDRYLQFTKQPQVFGTQYIMDPTHPVHVAGAPFPSGRTSNPITTASCPIRCGPIFAYRHWPSRSRTSTCSMLVSGHEKQCIHLAPDACAKDIDLVVLLLIPVCRQSRSLYWGFTESTDLVFAEVVHFFRPERYYHLINTRASIWRETFAIPRLSLTQNAITSTLIKFGDPAHCLVRASVRRTPLTTLVG